MDLSHLPIKLAVHCAALVQVKLKSDNKKYSKSLFVVPFKSKSFGKFTHTLSPDTFLFGVVGVKLMSGVERVELISGMAELVEIVSLTGVVLMSEVELVVGMSVELISESELHDGCDRVQFELAASDNICILEV